MICMSHHFSHFSRSVTSPRSAQHHSQGISGSLPAHRGCTPGQTPVWSDGRAITPGRSSASHWLGTLSSTDEAVTGPEERLRIYSREMERCTCPTGMEGCVG